MKEVQDAMDMPMFSRYGRAQATFLNIHLPGTRKAPRKPPPPKEKLDDVSTTQAVLAKALDEVTKELEHEADVKKSKKLPMSASFLAVSRIQRDHTFKPTYVENPAPNQYFPTQALVRPRTANNFSIQAAKTTPRARRLTLGTCMSEDALICKYVQKAIDGHPIPKRDPSAPRKIVLLDEYRQAVTDHGELIIHSQSCAQIPTIDLTKLSGRKDTSQKDVCEARFESFNYFPESYSGSRRIPSTDFSKSTSRKDIFIANQVDEMYDYDVEKVKKRIDLGTLDFSKVSARNPKIPEVGPESPDFPKLQIAYKRSLPRTHVKSFEIGKQTSRPGTAKTVVSIASPRSAVTTASVGSRTIRSARIRHTNSGVEAKTLPYSTEFRDTFSRQITD